MVSYAGFPEHSILRSDPKREVKKRKILTFSSYSCFSIRCLPRAKIANSAEPCNYLPLLLESETLQKPFTHAPSSILPLFCPFIPPFHFTHKQLYICLLRVKGSPFSTPFTHSSPHILPIRHTKLLLKEAVKGGRNSLHP